MTTKTPANPLVGHFFLTRGDGIYQGQIVEYLGDNYYLCQFYSWLLGEPTCKKLAHITAMTSWEFYDDAEMWREAGKRGTAL